MHSILKFLQEEDGPTAVEYAVMLAMVIAICLVGIGLAGSSTAGSFQSSFDQMDTAINGEQGAGEQEDGAQGEAEQ